MAPRIDRHEKNRINRAERKRAQLRARILTWTLSLAAVAIAGYGISQMSNIAFDEDDIKAVNFSGLDKGQKRDALEAANAARCTCGCGMTLAQCVATDMTCPVREGNIDRIKTMVREAQAGS